MRVSELSRRSGVPTATIKYYLREGLLAPGEATAATQAVYNDGHVRRLRLIRALIGVRGLSVSDTKKVLDAISEPGTGTHDTLGLVFGVIGPDKPECGEPPAPDQEVDALIEELGWTVYELSPARQKVAETVAALSSLGLDFDWRSLVPYAKLAEQTAVLDLDQLESTEDTLEKAERALLVTVLLEPALLALRRLAQESESLSRYPR